jgi:predicted nuclease of predicted toxin-antitoxin system
MKLLLDMNLSPLWLDALAAAGFEVVHWASVGRADDPDGTILRHAQEHGYVICTQDLDFGLMLACTGHGRPSVLQIRAQDVLPAHIGVQVIQALRQMAQALNEGALVTVDPKKTRVRVLPLRIGG